MKKDFIPMPKIKDGVSAKDMTIDEWYKLSRTSDNCRDTLKECEKVLDAETLKDDAGYISIEHFAGQTEHYIHIAEKAYMVGHEYDCEIAIDKAIEVLKVMKTFNRNYGF